MGGASLSIHRDDVGEVADSAGAVLACREMRLDACLVNRPKNRPNKYAAGNVPAPFLQRKLIGVDHPPAGWDEGCVGVLRVVVRPEPVGVRGLHGCGCG